MLFSTAFLHQLSLLLPPLPDPGNLSENEQNGAVKAKRKQVEAKEEGKRKQTALSHNSSVWLPRAQLVLGLQEEAMFFVFFFIVVVAFVCFTTGMFNTNWERGHLAQNTRYFLKVFGPQEMFSPWYTWVCGLLCGNMSNWTDALDFPSILLFCSLRFCHRQGSEVT